MSVLDAFIFGGEHLFSGYRTYSSKENNVNIMNSNDSIYTLKPIDLNKIKTIAFPEDQYKKEMNTKTQIVLHHTVSGDGVNGDISTWEGTPERIATCIIIDRQGIPWQLFSSKYWAYHLGAGNEDLDKHSIGIEIDCWGWVKPTSNGTYKTYYGNEVELEDVEYYEDGFRGYKFYEKYTDAQIQTIGELILYWNKVYGIPLKYNEDMWNLSRNALNGKPGIWSHVSYRKYSEKTDAHPQKNLVEMLKSLEKSS
jgi:N-acetyl-anhydromuramyl-L-alanine amidase AmpD